MAEPNNRIVITGLEETISKLKRFPVQLREAMGGAGAESAEEILDTEGLRNYPPSTAANEPPTPYYIRGQGTQYANSNKGNSERYGTKFATETRGYSTVIGNTASYSKYLAGDEQAEAMARIGWRKLFDVAKDKLPTIQLIYTRWLDRAKKQAGL